MAMFFVVSNDLTGGDRLSFSEQFQSRGYVYSGFNRAANQINSAAQSGNTAGINCWGRLHLPRRSQDRAPARCGDYQLWGFLHFLRETVIVRETESLVPKLPSMALAGGE